MSVIGAFKPGRDGGWVGEIHTLTINAKVRLVPNDDRRHPDAPAFRLILGWSHIGDAWEEWTRDGRAYLRVHIDDPSFPAEIRAVLLTNEDGALAQLIWRRHKPGRRQVRETIGLDRSRGTHLGPGHREGPPASQEVRPFSP